MGGATDRLLFRKWLDPLNTSSHGVSALGMLYVRCKACDEEFRTGISIGFAGRPVLGVHSYTCPECGHEAEYQGDDYFEEPAGETVSNR